MIYVSVATSLHAVGSILFCNDGSYDRMTKATDCMLRAHDIHGVTQEVQRAIAAYDADHGNTVVLRGLLLFRLHAHDDCLRCTLCMRARSNPRGVDRIYGLMTADETHFFSATGQVSTWIHVVPQRLPDTAMTAQISRPREHQV